MEDVESANNDNPSEEFFYEEEQEVDWKLCRLGKIPVKNRVL